MMSVEEVKNAILSLKDRIVEVEKSNTKLSETDTRQGLINPLFTALGWDFSDFNQVKSELRHASYNEPVDYAFFPTTSKKNPILLLEAKSFGTNLDNPKIIKQICTYLGEMGVQWGVLSDGNRYVMYNSKAGSGFTDQKFLSLQIKNVNTEDGLEIDEFAEKLVALLSRKCLENEDIQDIYEEHMVNGQIQDALLSLLSQPFDTLASAIRKEFKVDRVKSNSDLKISIKRIVQYLEEISDEERKIPVDFQSGEAQSDEEIMRSVVSSSEENISPDKEIKRRTRRITIQDLLEDKLASEGDNWRLEYKGEVSWARVTGNGELEINGKTAPNPSKAGTMVIGRPCPGWNVWYFKDKKGDWAEIEQLRKEYREKHGIKKMTRNRRSAAQQKAADDIKMRT